MRTIDPKNVSSEDLVKALVDTLNRRPGYDVSIVTDELLRRLAVQREALPTVECVKDQPQKADRYTVLARRLNDELLTAIQACEHLGLVYFITPRQGTGMVSMHVFFDEAGMDNYLDGFYREE